MHTKRIRLASTILLAALVSACGGSQDDGPPPPPAATIDTNLLPQTIDPAVTTALATHVSITPSPAVARANRLFVFLPGTGLQPTDYQQVLQSASAHGLHALGLDYPDSTEVSVLCASAVDSDACFWNVRREIITGTDYAPQVSVGPHDAIVTRLAEALAYLAANFPDQGWGQYLQSDGSVNWSQVVVGGHSQGGGHAAAMAKLYAMHGACYFDAPADWVASTAQPASWEAGASLTPVASQFGFTNTQDTTVPYDELLPIWQSMGLAALGAATSVDAAAAPYGGSHMLTTTASAATALDVHSLTVADFATPMAAGKPVYDPVWADACFH